MKKLFGLFSTTLLATLMCVGLTNRVKEKAPETAAPRQTLEVRDVLRKGAEDGEGNVVRRNAAAPTTYGMSDAKIQVTAPDENERVDIRFVAGIDSFDYSNAQFTILMHNEEGPVGSITREVTSAYMAIELEGEVKTAAEVFGEGYDYFIAYTLKGMPKTDWLNNSFEIGTGLKQAEDEEYTEHYTEEIKSVNEAVYSDHLLFTWKPYNEYWGTLNWENDFYASQVDATLVPGSEKYGDNINAALKAKVIATITDENGNTYTGSGTHAVGNAYETHSINMQFVNFSTQSNAYTLDVSFTYDVLDAEGNIVGQNTVKGRKEFTRLPGVENAIVTPQEDGTFVLTYDAVPNANSYAYRIYNETYSGKEISVISGATLETAILEKGTYNLDIIAYGDYNAPSTTTITNAFIVENAIQILDGSDKFEFEVFHKGNDYQAIMRFKPIDEVDAVTADNALQSIAVASPSKEFTGFETISYTIRDIKATKSHPYYDESGYYTIGYNHDSSLVANEIVLMTFVIKTDANVYYSIDLHYYMENDLAVCGTSLQNMYINWLDYELEQFIIEDYSTEGWAQINKIHDDAVTELETASDEECKLIYETATNAMKNVAKSISILDAKDYYDLNLYHKGGAWEFVLTFAPKDSKYAITSDNKITDLAINRLGESSSKLNGIIKWTEYSIKAENSYPYYDDAENAKHYVFGFQQGGFDVDKIYEVYFIAQDDSGQKYRFHFFYTAINTSEETTLEYTWARDYYASPLTTNFGFTNKDCYSEENWNIIVELYNEVVVALNDSTYDTKKLGTLIETNKAAAKAVNMDNIVMISKDVKASWTVTGDSNQNFAKNNALIDNNYGYGWQLNNNASGRYYQIELDQTYDLEAIYIKWEAANAADYDIYVSTDGEDWEDNKPVGHFSTTPKLEGREDLICLNDANNVRYIRIVMNIPGTQYGYQAYEIDLFIAK